MILHQRPLTAKYGVGWSTPRPSLLTLGKHPIALWPGSLSSKHEYLERVCTLTLLCVVPALPGTVEHLVEALNHNTGGYTFDSPQGPFQFSGDLFFRPALTSRVIHLAFNRNEYQGVSLRVKYVRSVELTPLPSWLSRMLQ